uniref:Transmembrane protein 106C n=1 Tax=Serinus canaria TaxID=9135 RepID=A0A8C9MRU3_SERCA
MGSVPAPSRSKAEDDEDEEPLVSQEATARQEVAKVPYMEVTGQDSVTCPTCRGHGCVPTEQVHELVALIPYSDQRLRPHRTKLYVLLSVLLCLLLSALAGFLLFPHSLQVNHGGLQVVQVWFDSHHSAVLLAITASLRIRNSNFYWVAVSSLSSQVQYMNTVVGRQQLSNLTSIQPLRAKLVLTGSTGRDWYRLGMALGALGWTGMDWDGLGMALGALGWTGMDWEWHWEHWEQHWEHWEHWD